MKIEISQKPHHKLMDVALIVLWSVILVWAMVDISQGDDVAVNTIVSLAAVLFLVLDIRCLARGHKIDKAESV